MARVFACWSVLLLLLVPDVHIDRADCSIASISHEFVIARRFAVRWAETFVRDEYVCYDDRA